MPVDNAMQLPAICYRCRRNFAPGIISSLSQLMESLSIYQSETGEKSGRLEVETEKENNS